VVPRAGAMRGGRVGLLWGWLIRGRSRCQRGQKPERIDVTVRFVGFADAQVDVRLARLSDRPHEISLAHRQPPRDRDGTEPL
jgi:hypothetical protein